MVKNSRTKLKELWERPHRELRKERLYGQPLDQVCIRLAIKGFWGNGREYQVAACFDANYEGSPGQNEMHSLLVLVTICSRDACSASPPVNCVCAPLTCSFYKKKREKGKRNKAFCVLWMQHTQTCCAIPLTPFLSAHVNGACTACMYNTMQWNGHPPAINLQVINN